MRGRNYIYKIDIDNTAVFEPSSWEISSHTTHSFTCSIKSTDKARKDNFNRYLVENVHKEK